MLTRQEQVPGEELHEGDHVKVYVVEVAATDRGPALCCPERIRDW